MTGSVPGVAVRPRDLADALLAAVYFGAAVAVTVGALVAGGDDRRVADEAQLARWDAAFAAYAAEPGDDRQRERVAHAFRRVHAAYLNAIPASALIDAALAGVDRMAPRAGAVANRTLARAALEGMMGTLDPHSAYLDDAMYEDASAALSGAFNGIGIRGRVQAGVVEITAIAEGSPAARSGLGVGDAITHLDDYPVAAMTLGEIVRRFRGAVGSIDVTGAEFGLLEAAVGGRLALGVRREAGSLGVTVEREVIRPRRLESAVHGAVLHLRVERFSAGLAKVLVSAVAEARAGGPIAGLVLDLRGNPGGLLEQAVAVADSFLEEGTIVTVRGRRAGTGAIPRRTFVAERGEAAAGLALVVLVDAGTASAAEIVAAVLQERDRGVVLGERTFGKGTVQSILPLPGEGAIKFTTAFYETPGGRTIQASGVEPDIVVTDAHLAPARREADDARAIALSGRPPAPRTRAVLALDDCPAERAADDALLGCAVALLDGTGKRAPVAPRSPSSSDQRKRR